MYIYICMYVLIYKVYSISMFFFCVCVCECEYVFQMNFCELNFLQFHGVRFKSVYGILFWGLGRDVIALTRSLPNHHSSSLTHTDRQTDNDQKAIAIGLEVDPGDPAE